MRFYWMPSSSITPFRGSRHLDSDTRSTSAAPKTSVQSSVPPSRTGRHTASQVHLWPPPHGIQTHGHLGRQAGGLASPVKGPGGRTECDNGGLDQGEHVTHI